MVSPSFVERQLRTCLVEDNPGHHVYRYACVRCGHECGPEFTMPHASSGRESDKVPIVVPECDCWLEMRAHVA
jgi:hypothetical protein